MPILNKKTSNPIQMKILSPDKPDIFDRIKLPIKMFEPHKPDIFDRISLPQEEQIKFMVEEAVKKAIESLPKPVIEKPKPQIIKEIVKEVRVEVPAKDDRDLVEMDVIKKLEKTIKDLQEKIEQVKRMAQDVPMPGGSGVIGIPPPEGNEGKTLKVLNNKAEWITQTGSGGGSLAGYTVNNHTELKTFDETDTSLDELAQLVGTIITELS